MNNKKTEIELLNKYLMDTKESARLEEELNTLTDLEADLLSCDEMAEEFLEVHNRRLVVERAYLNKRLEVLDFEDRVNQRE